MSQPEASHAHVAAEQAPDPHQVVYDTCLEEVALGLAAVESTTEIGARVPYDGIYGNLIGAMTEQAAAKGNRAEVERYIALLFRLPNASASVRARACFAGMVSGSVRAQDILQRALRAEKQTAERALSARRRQFPEVDPHDYLSSYLLQGAVTACEENNISPDYWIKTYSNNAGHRWKLYADHYGRLARKEMPDAQEHLHETAHQLLGGTFSDLFIFAEVPQILPIISNPELRVKLVNRVIHTKDVPLSLEGLGHFVMMGQQILRDPHLTLWEIIEDSTEIIDESARLLEAQGVNAVQLAQVQLPWNIGLEHLAGATPTDLIQSLDASIHQALSKGAPNKVAEADFQNLFLQRDALLATYATEAAQRLDFKAAQTLLADLMSQVQQVSAQRDCLGYATQVGQAAELRPSEFSARMNPHLGWQYQFAKAKLEGAHDSLTAMATELAATHQEGAASILKRTHLQEAYQTVAAQGPERGPAFAQDVLMALRKVSAPYDTTLYFSEILINADDRAEPERARQDILRTSKDAVQLTVGMWRLATILRSRYPDTCA